MQLALGVRGARELHASGRGPWIPDGERPCDGDDSEGQLLSDCLHDTCERDARSGSRCPGRRSRWRRPGRRATPGLTKMGVGSTSFEPGSRGRFTVSPTRCSGRRFTSSYTRPTYSPRASRWCKKVSRRKEGIRRRSEWRGLAALRAEPSVFIGTGGQLEITQGCNVTVTFYIFVLHDREHGLAPGSSLLGALCDRRWPRVHRLWDHGASCSGSGCSPHHTREQTALHPGETPAAPTSDPRCSRVHCAWDPGPSCVSPGSQ